MSKEELKKIDNFFDNLSDKELEKKLENSGIGELQEKEAIGILHGLLVTTFNYSGYTENGVYWQHQVDFKRDNPYYANALEIVLNLIEKLNKKYIQEKVAKEEVEELLENSVPKEAIREKIEELNQMIEEIEINISNTTDEEKAYWKREKHDLIMQEYILKEILGE